VKRIETYDRADDKEPDNHVHNLYEKLCVLSDFTVNCDLAEKFEADVKVEYCADADWPKEAHEEGLSSLFDLGYLLVHSKDYRKASE